VSQNEKLSYQQLVDGLRELCVEESEAVSLRYSADFVFDHYDSDLQALYVRELEDSPMPVTYEMLCDLEYYAKQLNKRLVVGIIYNAYRG